MKLVRTFACVLLIVAATRTATAHDLGGRPHVHLSEGAAVTALPTSAAATPAGASASALLPFTIAAAALALSLATRRLRAEPEPA